MKSSEPERTLGIGQVAERFGLATHVLRHWESMGLLSPVRAEAGRRRYGRAEVYRVAVVLRAKQAGFALDDIRRMFADADPRARQAVLRRHRADLARRIAQAQESLELVDRALECEHDDIVTCPRFQAVIEDLAGQGEPGTRISPR
ncbi:helix-turn-helix domain-containing protein [Qaidamihabitans albus]|uniref:helix-turn-helix domain-containing protein n=1 Tax=Qaidamihabitans albus TaxID=2795733 RepID=UPI0018F1A3A3|nr:MerR family transcriptional regulator [Qaidamihabitans albus]